MPSHDVRRCRTILLATSILLLPVSPSVARSPRDPLTCSTRKLHAEGRDLGATLSCHVRAKRRGLDVDPVCLAPVGSALEAAYGRAGTICSGNVDHANTLLVEWTNTLIDDIAGGGRCPASALGTTRRVFLRLGAVATDQRGGKAASMAVSSKRALCRAFRHAGDCAVSCDIVFGHVIAAWRDLAKEVGFTTSDTTPSIPVVDRGLDE